MPTRVALFILSCLIAVCAQAEQKRAVSPSSRAATQILTKSDLTVRYEKYALLIGNSIYDGPIFKSLSNAPAGVDIDNVKILLKDLQFPKENITVERNLNSEKLNDAIHVFFDNFHNRQVELKKRPSANSPVTMIAFFYYSGHGVTMQGTNYFVPRDFGRPDSLNAATEKAFPVDKILTRMADLRPSKEVSQVLVGVIDACRDEPEILKKLPFAATKSADDDVGLTTLPRPLRTVPVGNIIVFASQQFKPAAASADNAMSPFTQNVVDYYQPRLSSPVRLLFQDLRSDIGKKWMDQHPGELQTTRISITEDLQEDIPLNVPSSGLTLTNTTAIAAAGKPIGTKGAAASQEQATTVDGYIWIGNYDSDTWAPAKVADVNTQLISKAPASIAVGERYLAVAGLNMRSLSPAIAGTPTNASRENYVGTLKPGAVFQVLSPPVTVVNRSRQTQVFVQVRVSSDGIRNSE
jgi:hypothetical protein